MASIYSTQEGSRDGISMDTIPTSSMRTAGSGRADSEVLTVNRQDRHILTWASRYTEDFFNVFKAAGICFLVCYLASLTAPFIGTILVPGHKQLQQELANDPLKAAILYGSLLGGFLNGVVAYMIYRHPTRPGPRDIWRDGSFRARMWMWVLLFAEVTVFSFLSIVIGISMEHGRIPPISDGKSTVGNVLVVFLVGQAVWALIVIFLAFVGELLVYMYHRRDHSFA